MCGVKPATLLSPKWNMDLQRAVAEENRVVR